MAETPKNDNDLLRMQQEAIRRVRMMQQRAQQSVESESGGEHVRRDTPAAAAPRNVPPAERAHPAAAPNPGRPAHPHPQRNPRPDPPRERPRYAAKPQQNPIAALFGRSHGKGEDSLLGALFDGDSERTMLIVLLMILIDDQSDLSLILALLYLIL
ncbi:MAG: hypothetical protein ACOYJR_05780 [Acutalibacteraceae bacterium]